MTLYHDPTYFQTAKASDKPKRCRHKETLTYLAFEWCKTCGALKYQEAERGKKSKWYSPKRK